MRIECPSCAAGFDVNPSVLEPSGRTVRCASCKSTWFAAAPSLILANGEPAPAPVPAVTAEDRADHEALAAPEKKPAPASTEDAALVQIDASPSVTPEEDLAPPPAPKRKSVATAAMQVQMRERRYPLGLVATLLAAICIFGVVSRQSIVRAAPELASLYAAVGLPVNLRGLEFLNIRTKQEIQDGITILAIEGEVENIANRAVELPRVRLSVLGENGVEIYSWTALLPRSILYPHERVPFKSRLASPPAAGKEIMVRFLTRADLTASVR